MATFFNHHSFVILALGLWAGLALRPGPGTFTDTAQAEAAIGHGEPALVEFYSNY